MEAVRLLVQNLIVIIMLAVFLEMFLPQSDLRRYIRLVMGLLVIVAVLQVLSSLSKSSWQQALPEQAISAESPVFPSLSEITAAGENLNKDQRAQAQEKYRQSLARQVSALVGIRSDVEVVSAQVQTYDEPDSQKLGQIKKITLHLKNNASPAEGEKKSIVKPVEIQAGKNAPGPVTKTNDPKKGSQIPNQTKDKLVTILTNFYSLSPEQIIILEE
ncbi:MAG: stage III sporulation protein AF [Eubacteriales bacterium]|jgi:stage III sporulation protein AF